MKYSKLHLNIQAIGTNQAINTLPAPISFMLCVPRLKGNRVK